jgi:SAM-dependent methyltransferase
MSTDATWVGSMPEIYDLCLGPALFAPFAEVVAARAAELAPASVLELAAGTGIATAALVRHLPDAHIVATDLNPSMVSWASERVVGPTWRRADAQALDVAPSSFDLVVSQFGVMFFPDRVAAYVECARALRPGGAVLMAIWDTIDTSTFPLALAESLDVVLPDGAPTFVVRVPHGYTDVALIEADLRAGGLTDVVIDRVVLTSTATSAADLARGFCLGTPLRFALEEQGPLDDLTHAVADEMTARLGSGEVDGELAAFVVSARRPD